MLPLNGYQVYTCIKLLFILEQAHTLYVYTIRVTIYI